MKAQFKIALRSFARKPIYSLITLFGFSIGILSSLIIYLWIQNELSYEKFHPGYDRIFRVLTLSKQGDKFVKSAACYSPLAYTLKMDYPQIKSATFLSFESEDSPLQKDGSSDKIEARPLYTDDDFFNVFGGFKFIEGSSDKAFAKPSNIVLSEKIAKKLFGNQPALGKTLICDKYFKDVYTVGGVVSIPEQSHIDFGYVMLQRNTRYAALSNSWNNKGAAHVYIKLNRNASIDTTFLTRITNQLSRYSNLTDKLIFQPLSDIHLYSDYETSIYDKNISNYVLVFIFAGLAVLIIIMASLNFALLSIARASVRAVEIGIKKVNGAKRKYIIVQFMGESLFQTFAATAIALLLIWVFLPWFNTFTGQSISLNFSLSLVFNLLLISIGIGLVAGIYPSLHLSSFNPVGIFRKDSFTGANTGFIHILTTFQLSITIFFIVASLMIVKQLYFIQAKELGLAKDNIIVIPTGLWYANKEFKQELLRNPAILSVSATGKAPVNFWWKESFALSNKGITDSIQATLFWADEDFAKTYKLEMVMGEFLKMNYDDYWDEMDKASKSKKEEKDYIASYPVVINETAKRIMGLDDPIGTRIGDNVIVGVVKDFHFQPLQHPIGAIIIMNDPQNIGTLNVRIAPGKRNETLNYIQNVFRQYRDNRTFSYSFFDELLAREYKPERELSNLTVSFAMLAIVISLLGVFGMVHFSCFRRIKEIGIRKVNGAKTFEIIAILHKDLLKWVLISFLIATPIAWYAMHNWLETFAYKTELSWWIFALAGIITLGIALLTVSWQTWRAARRNPVESLRYE